MGYYGGGEGIVDFAVEADYSFGEEFRKDVGLAIAASLIYLISMSTCAELWGRW